MMDACVNSNCMSFMSCMLFLELFFFSFFSFLYSILLLAMKQVYWILYGCKISHKTKYTKGFLCSWSLLHNTLLSHHCHTSHLLSLFPYFFLWSSSFSLKTFWRPPLFLLVSYLLLWAQCLGIILFNYEGTHWWRFVMTTSVCAKQMLG